MFEQEIALLKDLKRDRPWTGSYAVKKAKFEGLLNGLCEFRGVGDVRLLIQKDLKAYGDCWPKDRKIQIRNFSVITLLHEFRHWLDYCTTGLGMNAEWRANYYSTYRFYYVWPERIKLLSELFREQAPIQKPENYKVNAHLMAIEDLVKGDVRL